MLYRVSYTEKETEKILEMTRRGLVGIFLYCKNVLSDGKLARFDTEKPVRAEGKGGKIYAPVSFFKTYLGLEPNLEKCKDKFTKNGVEYLPAVEYARECGLCADYFYERRLVLIGDEEMLSEVRADEVLEEAASYAVFGKYDAYSFTSSDYKQAKDEWRIRLVGSPEINSADDEVIKEKIAAVERACENKWSSMNRGEDRVILWGSEAPVESGELSRQYGGIADLAKGFGTYGTKFYKNEELLRDIIDALDWMYENMYGEAEMAGTGWRDVRLFNWWFWFVGGPEHLTDTLLIIEEHVTMEDKKRYLKCFEWITTIMRVGHENRAHSSSRLNPCTKTALLLEDPWRLTESHADCDALFGKEEYGEGIHKADYLNWTHAFPHNISYGRGNLDRTLYTSSILSSTPLDFSCPKKYNQFMLLKYTFEPSMYSGQGFLMFMGRSTFSSESDSGAAIAASLLPMIGVYGEEEDAYIKRFIKRQLKNPAVLAKAKRSTRLCYVSLLNSIMADDSIDTESEYEYAHAWFTGDRAAQHRNNYAFGIAMSSSREVAYECINDANKTGWYTGDGALYLYTDYDWEQYDGKNFLLNNLDVAYRYPGTTEDSRERVVRSINNSYAWKNPTDFAGSMKVHDKYITAGMEFISMHYEGEDNIVDRGYGGGLAPHKNDLKAKKAWFCFDDETVCLGAGISSTMSSPVHTTLEHRRIAKPELSQYVGVGDELITLPEESYQKVYTGASFVLMDGHAGYVFGKGSEAYVSRYTSESAGGQDFFEVRIEHGENPCEATYEYAVLPYASADKLFAYSKCPDYTVLSNTESLQAVRENKLGITGAVFYEAGELSLDGYKVSCDVPLIITVSDGCETDADTVEVMFSDPTHKLTDGKITVTGGYELVDASATVNAIVGSDSVSLSVDFEGAHGRCFTAKLRKI